MSSEVAQPERGVGAAFDAAHAGFAGWGPLLWDRIGAATVAAACPQPGDQVLDACCGASSSTRNDKPYDAGRALRGRFTTNRSRDPRAA